jgi:phage shock protein PspC (stress-responsive transcriptional regulator)
MKEVTRIHIAKTSYDVEIAAKKDLEAYLKALEAYSHDTDLVEDVEIRMTEILAERGVKKDHVISGADVKALKAQLGEPQEFKADGEDVDEPMESEIPMNGTGRKLYRDTDHAVLGGVLSGIAAFFGVNPALIRIIFILLLLASFGTALLVYVLLWAVVPPARTAADRLQMAGKPVTIASIREVNETIEPRATKMDENTKRTLQNIAGIICVMGAAGTAFFTAMVGFAVFFNRYRAFTQNIAESHMLTAALVFAIAAGLLLASLFGVLAYAAFARKMTKRVITSICIIICVGLLSFFTAVGLTQYVVVKSRVEQDGTTPTVQFIEPRNIRTIR